MCLFFSVLAEVCLFWYLALNQMSKRCCGRSVRTSCTYLKRYLWLVSRISIQNIRSIISLSYLKVLSSVTDWGFYFLANVYQIIEDWAPLSPVQAMQLLLPQLVIFSVIVPDDCSRTLQSWHWISQTICRYPDMRVRQKAIEWILCASSDFLFNALPQLVEALRFEIFESSSLAVALLTLSYKDRRFAFEIYWWGISSSVSFCKVFSGNIANNFCRQLQQRIDHCVDFAYAQRCSLLQKELLERHEEDHLR